jgi:protease IV
MGFDQDSDYLESSFLPGQGSPKPPSSSPPPPPPPPYPPYERPRRRFSGWRVFWGILFGLSVLANVGLFLMLIGLGVIVATGQVGHTYGEEVVRDGPRSDKIVVVNIEGIIHGQQADNVYRQLEAAREDNSVRALILRVNSPGGTISGSDRIYAELRRYRQETGRPIVAFMEGVAASGGYYASVACDKIVAEPTAITGSIGVVMSYFVFQELLENKLGIQPVFLTEGDKKDWPSSFRAPKQEELDYIQERLLTPAYERFVSVVEEGRSGILSAGDVRRLADGSIYGAPKALEEKLIDEIGYLDDAIEMTKSLAGIQAAQVVEYRRPFSFMDVLNAKSANTLKLSRTTLYELGMPEVLYMWSAY